MEAIVNADGKLEVTVQKEAPAAEVKTYDYSFLLSQRAAIIKQANDYLAQRQKELTEVKDLIARAELLGITEAVMPAPLQEKII